MTANSHPRKPIILVVDEETALREAVCENLRENGFAPLEAEDSDAALRHLRERKDIRGAVIDAHVPGSVDGVALVRLVRREWPRLAVVMTSGHSDETSGELPEGSEFINKPNLAEELAPLLRRLVEGRA
jgi:DNA-binding NtrC family response regulator